MNKGTSQPSYYAVAESPEFRQRQKFSFWLTLHDIIVVDMEVRMTLVRKVELARKLGVSKAYISKLIKQGRLIDQNGLVDDEEIIRWRHLKEQLLEAKLQNEILKGDLLRAMVKEKMSKLIPASAMRECLERKGKQIREAMLQIPTKLSDTLARSDKRTIHKLLLDEIRATLLRLCGNK